MYRDFIRPSLTFPLLPVYSSFQPIPVGFLMAPEQLLTIVEAARMLGLHRETVRQWAISGRLPGGFKIGDARTAGWRFRLSALEDWIRERTEEARRRTLQCSEND